MLQQRSRSPSYYDVAARALRSFLLRPSNAKSVILNSAEGLGLLRGLAELPCLSGDISFRNQRYWTFWTAWSLRLCDFMPDPFSPMEKHAPLSSILLLSTVATPTPAPSAPQPLSFTYVNEASEGRSPDTWRHALSLALLVADPRSPLQTCLRMKLAVLRNQSLVMRQTWAVPGRGRGASSNSTSRAARSTLCSHSCLLRCQRSTL